MGTLPLFSSTRRQRCHDFLVRSLTGWYLSSQGTTPVLKDVGFSIPGDQKLGLVGRSGRLAGLFFYLELATMRCAFLLASPSRAAKA